MGIFRGLYQKSSELVPRDFEALTLSFCLKFASNFTLKMKENNSRRDDFGSAEMGVFRGGESKIL